MRVFLVLAFLMAALGAARAQDAPSGDSVIINLQALQIPKPRWKPSPDELRPLAQARPRFKPSPEEIAALTAAPTEGDATTVAAVEPQQSAPTETAQPKPAPTAVVPAPATPEQQKMATPPPAPVVPVTIVNAPSPYSFPVEISGVARDPNANSKPINPLEGFAVLSRVRFISGKTDIPTQEQQALDVVVERLLTSHERVRLAAFSGKIGDASSEARRLSLARALAIRSYLVSKGVAVDRVDVLAYGGAKASITDRVHVLVRGT